LKLGAWGKKKTQGDKKSAVRKKKNDPIGTEKIGEKEKRPNPQPGWWGVQETEGGMKY